MQQIEIVNSRKEKLILKIVLYLTIGCCPHEIMKIKAEGSWVVIGEEIKIKKAWRCDGLAFTRTKTRFWKKKPLQQESRWRRSLLIYIFRR